MSRYFAQDRENLGQASRSSGQVASAGHARTTGHTPYRSCFRLMARALSPAFRRPVDGVLRTRPLLPPPRRPQRRHPSSGRRGAGGSEMDHVFRIQPDRLADMALIWSFVLVAISCQRSCVPHDTVVAAIVTYIIILVKRPVGVSVTAAAGTGTKSGHPHYGECPEGSFLRNEVRRRISR